MISNLTSIALLIGLSLGHLYSADMTTFKCDSLNAEASKTGLRISGYSQKAEWKDTHDLIIDFTSIISINAFQDDKNPRVSITSKEKIIDNGISENRIYWISFKSLKDLSGFLDFAWKGKSDNPAAIPIPSSF